ncbi:hypothetical protein KAT36_01130 [Candidatus Pacearchaeota archaeon]|nr:hypothetical protein [Candidatus Pacearchaeota archaeon]
MPQKEITPKTKYDYVSGTTPEKISNIIPEQFIPTKRLVEILGLIILSIIILEIFQFPYGALMSGNIDIVIQIGYPFPFFEFNLMNPSRLPLNISGMFFDLIIYIVLAYAIDISINLILKNPLTEAGKKKNLAVFKDKKITIADKITKKVFEK